VKKNNVCIRHGRKKIFRHFDDLKIVQRERERGEGRGRGEEREERVVI
jgi:hypothetical protein